MKENECNDSEGNRCRSSTPGVTGPLGKTCADTDLEDELDTGSVLECRRADGMKWDSTGEEGIVDVREGGGCRRIRRRPDTPSICSWST